MRQSTRSTIFVTLAGIAVLIARLVEPDKKYTFGHPTAVNVAVIALTALLAITHVVLSIIMWIHRDDWLNSEASMFEFITIKAIFWANFATSISFRGGIRAESALLFVLMTYTTIKLDYRLVERYVLGIEDRPPFPVDRRRIPHGRRRTDLPGQHFNTVVD